MGIMKYCVNNIYKLNNKSKKEKKLKILCNWKLTKIIHKVALCTSVGQVISLQQKYWNFI